jgi:uncharacterized membrane protein
MIAFLLPALTFLAILGSGLMAGLFFAFSVSVMSAFAHLPAQQGAAAMNAINVAILNPVFLTVFMGMTLICAVLAVKAAIGWSQPGSFWLLAGSLFYLVGIFAVTAAFNVPLNDMLAADASGAAWARYLAQWVPWNHVRTAAGMLSLACFWMAGR